MSGCDDRDGSFLGEKLTAQVASGTSYPLSEQDARKLATHTVARSDKVVAVSVPEDTSVFDATEVAPEAETRESIRIQALIATIGAQMGMSIWIPRADRGRVLKEWKNEGNNLLERLPLNYDDTTLRTIEQIDVLWLRGSRSFAPSRLSTLLWSTQELRIADLLALQPNMDIQLHIVAREAKREQVFQQIRRPVFSLLEKGPLAENVLYVSYDSVRELAAQKL